MFEIALEIIYSIVIGILLGGGFFGALLKTKGKLKITLLWGSGGSIVAVISLEATKIVDTPVTHIHVIVSIATLLTIAFMARGYLSKIHKAAPELNIGFSYLLASDNKLSELYDQIIETERRKKEQDSDLEKRIGDCERKEQELNLKEQYLLAKESEYSSKLSDLSEKIHEGYKLKLPYDKEILLSERFVTSIPHYVDSLLQFLDKTGEYISVASDEIHSQRERYDNFTIVDSYLRIISKAIRIELFGDENVRVHFRYFDGNEFKAFHVDSRGRGDEKVTTIPDNSKNMIHAATKCMRSVVRSVNPDFDYHSKSYDKWSDYLTMVFERFMRNEKPKITMGISIKHENREHQNLLRFLSFIHFERIIEEFLELLDQEIDLNNYIDNLSKEEVA